jgi:hypothetical protein
MLVQPCTSTHVHSCITQTYRAPQNHPACKKNVHCASAWRVLSHPEKAQTFMFIHIFPQSNKARLLPLCLDETRVPSKNCRKGSRVQGLTSFGNAASLAKRMQLSGVVVSNA